MSLVCEEVLAEIREYELTVHDSQTECPHPLDCACLKCFEINPSEPHHSSYLCPRCELGEEGYQQYLAVPMWKVVPYQEIDKEVWKTGLWTSSGTLIYLFHILTSSPC